MTWGDAMKDIKEKPTAHMPRSNATGEIPKVALKKAWAEAKEKSRTMLRESTSTQGDGDYTAAQDTSSVVTDTSYSVIKQNTDFTVQQGRKIARKQAEKYRERHAVGSHQQFMPLFAGHGVKVLLLPEIRRELERILRVVLLLFFLLHGKHRHSPLL